MQPVGNDTLSVHEIANRLKHRFEVVLFRLPTKNYVERLVDVLRWDDNKYNSARDSRPTLKCIQSAD